jgi:hypothetical protein
MHTHLLGTAEKSNEFDKFLYKNKIRSYSNDPGRMGRKRKTTPFAFAHDLPDLKKSVDISIAPDMIDK